MTDPRHQRLSKRPKWLKDEDYEAFECFDMRYTGFYQRIYFRNCEIIDHSDYCVFMLTKLSNIPVQKKHLNMQKGKRKK